MTKQTIEIEGLPEGWKAVAYRVPTDKIDYVLTNDCEIVLANNIHFPCLIVEKIPPRRIVLEETEKDNFKYTNGFYANQVLGNGIHIVDQPKIWREVKEGERSSTTFRERVINDLVHNAPHEGPGAASSRTVPLDAVVGGQKSALTGRQ